MQKTISKRVQIALDLLGGALLLAFLFAIGMCESGSAYAEAPAPAPSATSSGSSSLGPVVPIVPEAPPSMRATTPAWTEQEILLARLAINEASGRDADTAAIAIARRNNTPEELRRMHPRALNPDRTDGRRWIAGLDAHMGMPDGWPSHRVAWSDGQRVWMRTLLVVREVLRGERRCAGGAKPRVWGGRMDAEHINRRLAAGMVIVDCGATANVYLGR